MKYETFNNSARILDLSVLFNVEIDDSVQVSLKKH